jgi:hypothetical protein
MLKEVAPSGPGAAQLAVEIGLARAEFPHGFGDCGIFVGPVEAGAGQQLHRAAVEPRMHAVAVVFDFVEPLVAVRRRVDQLGQLRPDPFRQRGLIAAWPARYGARHGTGKERLSGSGMRLLELVDLADVPGGMSKLEADALAMPAGRKTPALDRRYLVRHVRMHGIVGNRVDAGLRHDLARPEFLRHGWPPVETYRRSLKRSSTGPRSVLRLSPE